MPEAHLLLFVNPLLVGGAVGLVLSVFILVRTAYIIGSGEYHDRRSGKIYTQKESPGTFWFHVLVYLILGCCLLAATLNGLWRLARPRAAYIDAASIVRTLSAA